MTAGAAGFLTLTQQSARPERYAEPSRFDTNPSQPSALGVVCKELFQSEVACVAGFLPGSELNARLFHGKASHGPEFPTVPVWCREAMRHFHMQLRCVVRRLPRRRVQSCLPTSLEITCAVAWIGLRHGVLPQEGGSTTGLSTASGQSDASGSTQHGGCSQRLKASN